MIKIILLVEDDIDLRIVVRNHLLSAGYQVFEAENGEIALKVFASQHIDLIVTDIDMPVKNGLELLDDVKLLDGHIPVVVMTGGNYEERLILQAGASAFVRKPFIHDIALVVEKVVLTQVWSF